MSGQVPPFRRYRPRSERLDRLMSSRDCDTAPGSKRELVLERAIQVCGLDGKSATHEVEDGAASALAPLGDGGGQVRMLGALPGLLVPAELVELFVFDAKQSDLFKVRSVYAPASA